MAPKKMLYICIHKLETNQLDVNYTDMTTIKSNTILTKCGVENKLEEFCKNKQTTMRQFKEGQLVNSPIGQGYVLSYLDHGDIYFSTQDYREYHIFHPYELRNVKPKISQKVRLKIAIVQAKEWITDIRYNHNKKLKDFFMWYFSDDFNDWINYKLYTIAKYTFITVLAGIASMMVIKFIKL